MNELLHEQIRKHIDEIIKGANVKEVTEIKFTITTEFTLKKQALE